MQTACRDFRENQPDFVAATGQMISFDAENAQESCMAAAKVSSSSKASPSGFGGEYERFWQGRGSGAAQDCGPYRSYRRLISTKSGFYRTFEVSITRKYSHWVLPRFKNEWSASA